MRVHGCTLTLLRWNEAEDGSDTPDELTAQLEHDVRPGLWCIRWDNATADTPPTKVYEMLDIHYCPECGEEL